MRERTIARSERTGFTQVELLVVVLIVFVGMALVAPAIQHSRNRRQEVVCLNRLKNITLGLMNATVTNGTFPSGWRSENRQPNSGPQFGWQTAILPYMDNGRLYRAIIQLEGMPPAGKDGPADAVLPFYRCPADTTGELNPMRGGYPTSNYSGNFGSDPVPRWVPDRRAVHWPGHVPTPDQANGVLYCNSRIAYEDIRDGTSNTIAVGERSVTSGAGIWPGVGDNIFENDQVTDCSHMSRLNGGLRGYSSLHDKVLCFAFCDGSARPISKKIESLPSESGKLGVFQRLGNRKDGQEIPASALTIENELE